jgi:hypothetical protein
MLNRDGQQGMGMTTNDPFGPPSEWVPTTPSWTQPFPPAPPVMAAQPYLGAMLQLYLRPPEDLVALAERQRVHAVDGPGQLCSGGASVVKVREPMVTNG